MMQRRATVALLALVLAGLAPATARADFDPEAWRFYREIKRSEGASGDNACFPLESDVWNYAAGPDLRDLRIIRGEADEVGYVAFMFEGRPPQVEERPARVFDIATRGTEASELKIDLGESPPMTNRIRINTSSGNFGCAVTVEGSDDLKTWKTLKGDGAIFDFGGDVHQRFTTVAIPDTRMRYLRVVVSAPPNGKPIALTGATVFQEMPPEPGEKPLMVDRPVVNRSESQAPRETHVVLDLGARHLPVSLIAVETPQENFWRSVQVDVSDDKERWLYAGSGAILRFRTDKYREERLALSVPEAFGRYVRLRIINGDDTPLPVSRVTVQGRQRYIFFPFASGQRYRLLYGNPDAGAPFYDYANTFQRIDRRAAVEVRLGEPHENPRFIATRAAPPPSPWVERNQWVLYAALAVAVAGLALVAILALRRPAGQDEKGQGP